MAHLKTRFKPVTEGALIVLTAVCVLRPAYAGQKVEVRTVSSRPEAVSGGDVLVQVTAPSESNWTAQLDGRDVTQSFHPAAGSGRLLALLSELKLGENTLEIRVNGTVKAKLEIINHPLAGPIFSGPHQEPFICQTVENGLGPALDKDCNAKTVVQYYYKSTEPVQESALGAIAAAFSRKPGTLSPGFKPYDPSGSPPSDVAQTVTSDGRTVNYIVRREIGVINRAVYDIQFLHQPGQPLPTPWTRPTPGWNGRLVYSFGGGCGGGHHQGTLGGGVGGDLSLAEGYALATSTLNVFGNSCNDRISAETLSMVKERFIKEYGEPVHTIGEGSSGGSMQVHMIAQNYPGLLDGILPNASYPDIVTTAPTIADCPLLKHAFKSLKQNWTEQQKTAVSGFSTWRTCVTGWMLQVVDPGNCDGSIPKEMIYDRISNPKGVRCDIYSNEINFFGRNPRTGFARRPLDNVGVQYGLVAFNSGKIDAEQFIELNERIGGFDEDGKIVATRMEADPEALRLAYQHGLVVTGGGGLGQIPIIDRRSYLDDLADGHERFRSLVTRARLIAANGNADNQVILVGPPINFLMTFMNPDPATNLEAQRGRDVVRDMDRWLDNIAADNAAGTPSEKVSRDRPANLSSGCWQVDGERIVEAATFDGSGKCNQIYPPHGDPRLAAGAPLTDDVLKCALKPVSAADYSQSLSAGQLERLKAIFPSGVCDFSRPGMGQEITRTTWQHYEGESQMVRTGHE